MQGSYHHAKNIHKCCFGWATSITHVDNTTEQVSELGVNFHLNIQQIRHTHPVQSTSLSSFSTPLMGSVLLFVCPNQTPLLSSSGPTEEKLITGFPLSTIIVQGQSSLVPRPLNSVDNYHSPSFSAYRIHSNLWNGQN